MQKRNNTKPNIHLQIQWILKANESKNKPVYMGILKDAIKYEVDSSLRFYDLKIKIKI